LSYLSKSNKWVGITGKAYAPNPNEPGRLILQLNIGPVPTKGNYLVIDTDYENYSLVYACEKELTFVKELAWILSRKKTLDAKVIASARDTLHSYGVDISKFTVTDQSNCP
jgi:apolipoprotein D and lipocalin family protein